MGTSAKAQGALQPFYTDSSEVEWHCSPSFTEQGTSKCTESVSDLPKVTV